MSWKSFNPRARIRARPTCSQGLTTEREFQSTRPYKGATVVHPPMKWRGWSFNPRARIRARRAGSRRVPGRHGFNPRARIRARPRSSSQLQLPDCSFNPRARIRARRVSPTTSAPANWFQSTRPYKGATLVLDAEDGYEKFQSTRPYKGATLSSVRCMRRFARFNPRARIRARPAWAALRSSYSAGFNPRARIRARRCHSALLTYSILFQSTRPYKGATPRAVQQTSGQNVSIHAPV